MRAVSILSPCYAQVAGKGWVRRWPCGNNPAVPGTRGKRRQGRRRRCRRPAAGGTRYTLAFRLAGRRFRKQQQQAIFQANIEKLGGRIKDFLEETAAPQRG